MLALLGAIPSLIGGLFGTINSLTAAISNEKIAGISAATDEARIASAERVKTLEAKRDLMIAEASTSRLNIYVRTALALGPASILLKIYLWDKVIGSFAGCSGRTLPGTCGTFLTDPLDPNLWNVVMVVVGFYFLHETVVSAVKVVKR